MSEDRNQSRGGLVIGLILVGLGIMFLIGQFLGFNIGNKFWPLFVIIPGLLFFGGMVAGGKKTAALAIPGSIITMVGLILFYQSVFDYYVSWTYAWALIPTAVGIGIMISGYWGDNPRDVKAGRQVMITGIILFIAFGAFFELVLGLSGRGRGGPLVWSLLLIGAGLLVFWRTIWGSREPERVYRPLDTPMRDARYEDTSTTVLGSGTVEPTQPYVPPTKPVPPAPLPPAPAPEPMPERRIPVEPEPVEVIPETPPVETVPPTEERVKDTRQNMIQGPVLGRGVIEDSAMPATRVPVEPLPVEQPAAEVPGRETPPTWQVRQDVSQAPVLGRGTVEAPDAVAPARSTVAAEDVIKPSDTYASAEQTEPAVAPEDTFVAAPAQNTGPIPEAWQPVTENTTPAESYKPVEPSDSQTPRSNIDETGGNKE